MPRRILLDINIPGEDGFMAAALLAEACPVGRIVLTSPSVWHLPEELLRACAAVAFVPKEELASADLGALFRPEGT